MKSLLVPCGFRKTVALLAVFAGLGEAVYSHPESHGATTNSDRATYSKAIILSERYKAAYQEMVGLRSKAVPSEPLDEPMGGYTLHGTPVIPRGPDAFPAESRDLFWQMDMVPTGPGGPLRPLSFDLDGDGHIDKEERKAIQGRNTWLLWGGGNEGFWNWLAQDGYGITDFLILLDSRTRKSRYERAGLINQPGFQSNADPDRRILGLYLDAPADSAGPGHRLKPPIWESYEAADKWASAPGDDLYLFDAGDPEIYTNTLARLYAMGDGVNYAVYGFPSGIFGLRLFPNPDFFGRGPEPARARDYWKKRVEDTNGRYYEDRSINQDPKLVRPFRVSMSCGFCHTGPHPLNPPKDPEAPEWANLSSNIGNQYWKPQPAFANLQDGNSFLFHFLASQQPGTIDTSLVSSDHINNANTINAVFEINARLARAAANPTERQSVANVRVPSIEDPTTAIKRDGNDQRHTPRVLLDGSDSIGAFGALARVYLNIGTFYEEWATCHNPIIGFKKQRPFRLEVCQRNSVYWQVNEKYRTEYLAKFFTMRRDVSTRALVTNSVATAIVPSTNAQSSTQPMKLADAKEPGGESASVAAATYLALDSPAQRRHGRAVWLQHCAICHSSKQPKNFGLTFDRKTDAAQWALSSAPTNATYTLPYDAGLRGANWTAFKESPAYQHYLAALRAEVEQAGPLTGDPLTDGHPFWRDNYLSTDIRIPITLVETSSGRSLASNAIEDNVWDNFSSITYKGLSAVGPISFFNPINGHMESFAAPGGGRGYYRPASHVSLWATAPFLHNNTLGVYLHDPSVRGRLVQFSDAMRRMLWLTNRANRKLLLAPKEKAWLAEISKPAENSKVIDLDLPPARLGDLRAEHSPIAAKDPGFIYRVPKDTQVQFAAVYFRPLVHGIAGPFLTSLLELWLWVALAVVFGYLAYRHEPRALGIALLAFAIVVAVGLGLSGLGGGGTTVGTLLMGASGLLEFSSWQWWLVALALASLGVAFIQARPDGNATARWLLAILLAVGVVVVAIQSRSVWATAAALLATVAVGAWFRPTLARFARAFFVILTLVSVVGGYAANRVINGKALVTIPVLNKTIGPFPVTAGPIPRGTPVNLVMNLDPESPNLPRALVSMILAMAEIKKQGLTGEVAWEYFRDRAGQPLMDANKCRDFVLDRGHLFGENLESDSTLNDQAKEDLIAFLKTL